MDMKNNKKGFALIEGLLIILILAVVGFGGYNVLNNQHKSKTANSTSTSNTPVSDPTLAQAVTQTQTAYDAWTKAATNGQVLQDKSQWAQNNVLAAEDLQLINNNKSWFTASFLAKANNYENTNAQPTGGEFFACTSGIAYYNADAKATGDRLSGQTANVTVNYTDGSPGTGGETSYSIPITLKATNGLWAIDSIDLSGCSG